MPLLADAAPPVRIERCYLVYNPVFSERWDGYRAGPLYITFVNTGTNEIRSVHFRISTPERSADVVDRGRFSPNVRITHAYSALDANLAPYEPRAQPKCTLVSS
jgi:hypothetical protein